MNIRRLFILCVVCALLFTQMGISFATENESSVNYDIQSLDELKESLSEVYELNPTAGPETPEVKQVVENTSPNVVNEFLEEKMDLIGVAMSDVRESTEEHTVDLGDGCYLVMGSSVPFVESDIAMRSTPGAQTLWKDYGNRKYTSTFEGYLLIASFNLNICNHYTLGKNGISPRYVEAWGEGGGVLSVSTGNVNEPKRSAKVGETVSSNCIFSIRVNGSNSGADKTFKMYNYIKCSEIDTVEKQVKVVQSWKGDYL